MDAQRLAFLECGFRRFHVRGWDQLRERLLAHGGVAMVPQKEPEEHVRVLLRDGELFEPRKITLDPGEPNQCHANCARLWAWGPEGRQLATGYALCAEGLWRQHSWLWHPGRREIVETTSRSEKYFGAVLEGPFALGFIWANAPELQEPGSVPEALLPLIAKVLEENPESGRPVARRGK